MRKSRVFIHHYAAKACIILKSLARKHGMDKLIITCNPDTQHQEKPARRPALSFAVS